MGLKDIVAGLELSPVLGKYGIYVRCDTCGATLDGARINVGTEAERIGADDAELAARARSLGWTGPLSRGRDGDACPECSRAATSRA